MLGDSRSFSGVYPELVEWAQGIAEAGMTFSFVTLAQARV